MFRNNRVARILFPLVIIAILVVVMELVDSKKTEDKNINIGKCTIEIECKNILKNKDILDLDLRDAVPKDGVILEKTKVDLKKGNTAYDVLKKVCKDKNISVEINDSLGGKYIVGIDNFYEKCCGGQSGWVYMVNGKQPGKSSSEVKLKNGDRVHWGFTCNLGKDVKE